jgi:hypothetical protein
MVLFCTNKTPKSFINESAKYSSIIVSSKIQKIKWPRMRIPEPVFNDDICGTRRDRAAVTRLGNSQPSLLRAGYRPLKILKIIFRLVEDHDRFDQMEVVC